MFYFNIKTYVLYANRLLQINSFLVYIIYKYTKEERKYEME